MFFFKTQKDCSFTVNSYIQKKPTGESTLIAVKKVGVNYLMFIRLYYQSLQM